MEEQKPSWVYETAHVHRVWHEDKEIFKELNLLDEVESQCSHKLIPTGIFVDTPQMCWDPNSQCKVWESLLLHFKTRPRTRYKSSSFFLVSWAVWCCHMDAAVAANICHSPVVFLHLVDFFSWSLSFSHNSHSTVLGIFPLWNAKGICSVHRVCSVYSEKLISSHLC